MRTSSLLFNSRVLPRINAIGTAVPDYDFFASGVAWGMQRLASEKEKPIYERMMSRCGISKRYSVLGPGTGTNPNAGLVDEGGYYFSKAGFPSTADRMQRYAVDAPQLALRAVAALGDGFVPSEITHLVVASCTGFVAPGIDQIIAERLGLATDIERLLIGFMGCYAGITALKAARNIVRSDVNATVLVISVELCSLHVQESRDLQTVVAMSLFSDGSGAAIVSAHGSGLTMDRPFAAKIPGTENHIRWNIGNHGFMVQLLPDVHTHLAAALSTPTMTDLVTDGDSGKIDAWAVHPGGRAIVDAVQRSYNIEDSKLAASRDVLSTYGNMCSATVMFVLQKMLGTQPKNGVAMAFGPGLAAEGFRIAWTENGS